MTATLDRHRERFLANPADARAFAALEEGLFLGGRWDELIAVYEVRLGAPDLAADGAARAPVLFRLGQVCEERAGDPERAISCYRDALGADPRFRPALEQMRRLHSERGQWEMALQIAEAEAALPLSPADHAALSADVGAIWLDRLGDAEQARLHLERAASVEPAPLAALTGLARAETACGHPREAAAAWERALAQLRGPERAPALVALAKLAAGPLAAPERAIELYRRALTEDPRHAEAIEAMAEHARQRRQWPLLADLQERRFELTRDPQRRVEIALDAGQIERDRLSNSGAARVWFARAAELAPDDPRIFESLAEFERQRGDETALLRCLERVLELSTEAPRVSVLLEVASLHSAAGRDERAAEALRRAVEVAPEDVLVVEALSDTLARLGRDDELVEVLERRAALAAADPEMRAVVLADLGALLEERLADPEAARQAYERAFEADPGSPEVGAALERLYRKAEAWTALRSFLERAAQVGPPGERAARLCALGEVLAGPLGAPDEAGRVYEAALALDPKALAAHRGLQELAATHDDPERVIRALVREAEVTTDRARLTFLVSELARRFEAAGRAADALPWVEHLAAAAPEDADALRECARLQEALGRDDALVQTLEQLAALLQGPERAATLRRLGIHHAMNDRREESIRAFQGALDADASDIESLERLVELLGAERRWEELARARRWLADLLPPAPRAACLSELARLLDEKLGDPNAAIDTLLTLAREVDAPGDVEERVESLLERAGRIDELVERLRERALTADPLTAAGLGLRRAALLLDPLGRPREAAETYRAVWRVRPEASEARIGLERALRAAGDPAALAEYLAIRAQSADDPAERDAAALEHAGLLEDELDAPDEAREIYRRLAVGSDDWALRDRAAERLEALLERGGMWKALRAQLEERLTGEPSDAERARHERLAALCRDRLGEHEAAIAHLEQAIEIAPRRVELWRSLATLYERLGRHEALAGALESELEAGVDVERELVLRSRAAALYAGPLADVPRARNHYERVLDLDPSHSGAAEFLIEHWERDGRYNAVVRLLERRLDALDELPREAESEWKARRTSLRLRIAGLCAGSLDDLDGAIAALEPALGEIGPQPVVAEPLADLYRRAGYHDDYRDLCRSAAGACSDAGERATWTVRLGDALRERDELREAAEAYRRALSDRPDDRETQAALRDLYRKLGEAEPLARMLEADLSQRAGADEVPVRLELAALLAEPLGRPGDALLHLRRVLELEPGHAEALDRSLALVDAQQAEGNLAPAAAELVLELIEGALGRRSGPDRRSALLARRARLLGRLPGRADDAVRAYREALAADPSSRTARRELRSLLEQQQQWDAVLECLFEEARGAESEIRAALFERAADIAHSHVSSDAALPWLERLRRERPLDAQVVARIADAHRRAGRIPALLHALDDEIALCEQPARRRDLRVEKAELLEQQLESPSRAAAALEEARADFPRDTEVLHALDRLYRALGRQRERASVLESLVKAGRHHEQLTLICEIASLYAGPLADPRRAAAHLLTAVAAAPRGSPVHCELLRTLGDALRSADMTDAWARCAEEELRGLDPDAPVFAERRRWLRRELATVYEQRLGRPDAALRHLRILADSDDAGAPADAGADAAELALLRLLRAEGNWVELESCLSERLARDSGDAADWLELARVRDERLHAPAAAAEAYRRVLEREPECLPAIRGLRGAAERLGEWAEVAGTLERELDLREPDPSVAPATLLRRLGDVTWHRLGSTTRASRSYAAALESDPRDFEALRSLEHLLEAMEDWRGTLDLYESEIEVLGDEDPERRQTVWLRVGALARDRTHEPERARRAYLAAADLGELEPAQLLDLAELHEQCGDREAFVAAFARWCDDPAAPATGPDHLRLGEALEALGRSDEALARVRTALDRDEALAPAWDAQARLLEAAGAVEQAAAALCRAAEHVGDAEAAERLLHAAELTADDDARGAAALLRKAAERDPGSIDVQAALAEVCGRLSMPEEVVAAARRALDLAGEADEWLTPEARLELTLAGGRAARERGLAEEASRFFTEALEIDDDHPEALAGFGDALAEQGDLATARRALEARLARDDDYPERPHHLAILGAALEADDDVDAAIECYEQALRGDPRLEDAHAALVRLHEEAERVDAGVAALERWADAAREPGDRTERLLRAAAWELSAGGRQESAERHLREVLETDPASAHTWEALATLLWDQGRSDEALDVASRALDGVEDRSIRATLALVRGRALEQKGESHRAAEAYRDAAAGDARCAEAALAAARILRGHGEWREAAEVLEQFAAASPGDDDAALAEVLHQLARLLAGPLEDVDGAVEHYRRALALAPERRDVRSALAELLSHRPDCWKEALAQQRQLLEEDPADAGALRMVLRIARTRGSPAAITRGLQLLRALGLASPRECDEADAEPPLALAPVEELGQPLWEKLRLLAQGAADELASALEASDTPPQAAAAGDDRTAGFRATALAAEGHLGASALLPLPTEEVAEVLTLAAALCLDSDELRGDGHLVNALSSALGRRARKRLRRLLEGTSLDEIRDVDFAAWRSELRALAAARAVDETGFGLRRALLALVRDASEGPPAEPSPAADITPLVAPCPEARALVRLAVRSWLRSL